LFRAAIFLKAADLIAGKYRADICASVMLGQGKNVWQAEIDAAAEVRAIQVDQRLRNLAKNSFAALRLPSLRSQVRRGALQPAAAQELRWCLEVSLLYETYLTASIELMKVHSSRVEYRPLEGFVFAVSPFNFA